MAEANVRSRSRALYGVHLIQVGFTELRAYGQPGVNAWAKCLLQEDELYLFVFCLVFRRGIVQSSWVKLFELN